MFLDVCSEPSRGAKGRQTTERNLLFVFPGSEVWASLAPNSELSVGQERLHELAARDPSFMG